MLTDVAKANALVRKLEKALATSLDPQEVETQLVIARVSQKTSANALAKHQTNLPSTLLPEQEQ